LLFVKNPKFLITRTIFFIAFECNVHFADIFAFECDVHLQIRLLWLFDDSMHDKNAFIVDVVMFVIRYVLYLFV